MYRFIKHLYVHADRCKYMYMCISTEWWLFIAVWRVHNLPYAGRPSYCQVPGCTCKDDSPVHTALHMYLPRAMQGTSMYPSSVPTEFYNAIYDTWWYTEISRYIPRFLGIPFMGIPRNLGIPIPIFECTETSCTILVSTPTENRFAAPELFVL